MPVRNVKSHYYHCHFNKTILVGKYVLLFRTANNMGIQTPKLPNTIVALNDIGISLIKLECVLFCYILGLCWTLIKYESLEWLTLKPEQFSLTQSISFSHSLNPKTNNYGYSGYIRTVYLRMRLYLGHKKFHVDWSLYLTWLTFFFNKKH